MNSAPTVIIAVELDDVAAGKIAQLACIRNVSEAELVRSAIDDFLLQEADREHLDKGGDDALSHFERTGLHLTHEEVDSWLAEVEAGNFDAELPQCHR